MKAIRVHETGDPGVLRYEEVATPEPGAGEVLVQVEAAGVNFIDTYQRRGQYSLPLPFIPGQEAAGKVVAVGSGVSHLAPGARVAQATRGGSYAEYVVFPADQVVPVPEGISAELAAAVMLQGMTAHYLSHSTYPIRSGDTVLIHAAAGGVGQLLVQMAKNLGARVIGTASTQDKAALARGLGADEMILYTQVNFRDRVKELTGGQGVEAVYDSVGRTTFVDSLDCLKPRGMMVLFGQSSGPVEPFDPQILNRKGSLYLTRPSLGHYVADRAALMARAKDLFDWMTGGQLRVRIDRTFPLVEAAAAHRYVESRKTQGKVLLIPS